MKIRGFCLLMAAMALAVQPAQAHENHNHGNHNHKNYDPSGLCENFIAKADSNIPDLTRTPWQTIKVIKRGFRYVFYHDGSRPEIAVAALSVMGTLPGQEKQALTRVTWQVGNEIRTVRLEIDEMVCVRPLLDRNGDRRGLDEIMLLIEGGKTHGH